jgi:hypothetical protein
MRHDSFRPPKIVSSRRRKTADDPVVGQESTDGATAPPEISPGDAARYVGEMTAELARFAQRHQLPTLAYFLEMAHIEAGDEARRLEPEPLPPVKRGRR